MSVTAAAGFRAAGVAAGVKSSLPLLPTTVLPSSAVTVSSQSLSAPPQALQMALIFFVSALAIASAAFCGALPSGAFVSGHVPECLPFKRASQHFWRFFSFASTNFIAFLPIAIWHLLSGEPARLGTRLA